MLGKHVSWGGLSRINFQMTIDPHLVIINISKWNVLGVEYVTKIITVEGKRMEL